MLKTYNQLYIDTRNVLRANGVEAANLEARLIVARAAGKTADELVRDFMLYANHPIMDAVAAMLRRRLEGEPLAYILGSWEFYGLDLNVSPDVLIPRPDTEVLVDHAVQTFRGRMNNPRVLDLCCGSGCIGCAIGKQLPMSRIVMVDLSEKALRVARSNIMKCMLGAKAACIRANVFDGPPAQIGTFDLIVSNPPYIRSNIIPTLSPQVRAEPHIALDGGESGLRFYEGIIAKYPSQLTPCGRMLLEIGYDQAESVRELARLRDGEAISQTSLRAAQEQLENARTFKAKSR